MRREIIGIILFFLVLFTLISLLSYSHEDPSINHAVTPDNIQNLFGLFGAHISGILIGLFGIGAFWVPIMLLFLSIHFFDNHPKNKVVLTITGGILLIIATGSLFSLYQSHYIILGDRFDTAGIIVGPLKTFLIKYSNIVGCVVILALILIIGFILATGFSPAYFTKRCLKVFAISAGRLNTLFVIWQERKKKRQRLKTKKMQTISNDHEIEIKVPKIKLFKSVPVPKQEVFEFMRSEAGFKLPSINLLDDLDQTGYQSVDNENLKMQSKVLEKKLGDFGVRGKVTAVLPGPVVTTFEYEPAPGIKINKIVNLTDDLALALRAASIRIVAPIPGKAVIGIEIPNDTKELVRFKEIVSSRVFEKAKSKITICLGKNIVGDPVTAELDKMPHLLIAGATGTGKSVGLNAMICSFLYKASPDEVKLIMIDPKRIELSAYDGIPHLITPVVTDVKKATNALFWAVNEMEKRYELLSEKKVKNIKQYNQKIDLENKGKSKNRAKKLPLIVIIIDELADLMMVASRDVEVGLTRLAQMARAAGIHLILATQRPSVDVLTGIIKANFPTRLTFQVSSKTDSRTIIDTNGAENLLGNGDMLFMPPGTAKLQRIHGAYISESELARITEFLKNQKTPEYNNDVIKTQVEENAATVDEEHDEKYDEAIALVTKTRQASISMIQRYLRIGYNRAARIVEVMEKEGVVGPSDGSKPREVLVRGYDDMP